MAGETRPLDWRQNLILASALFNAKPPMGGMARSSTHRVLRQAMRAAGEWDGQLEEHQSAVFHGVEDKKFPLFSQWYTRLIELTYEPEPTRLLEGAGNLGDGDPMVRAGAYFTGCWLTPPGRAVAEAFMVAHPALKAILLDDE